MKKEEIHFGDLHRWIFGQTPPQFMLEVFIRTIFIFIFLLVIMRLMGKRMAGQMTITELAVMVTLGAIVSPVMQLPDRGILFGIISLLCAYIFQRYFNLLGFKSKKAELITQGHMSILVKDGSINLEELEKSRVTKQQLYAMLREKKVLNLGKVERAYLEACGIFTVYEAEEPKAGLPILPASDPRILTIQMPSGDSVMACCNCGHVQTRKNNEPCEACNANDWSKAYLQNQ